MQFSALFSYMLWHIELQFCIWLCLTILQIKFECHQFASIFVGVMPLLELRILEIHSFPHFSLPFFIRQSSDGTYYGMVMSVRPSVRPSQFSAHFSYMLWHIDLKFCVSLYFYARKIKFECHQFPSLFAGVMPLLNFKLLQICSFLHFSPTCFGILSWNFAYDFVLLYYRSSSSVINLRQFL